MAQKNIGNRIPIHTLNTTEQIRDFYNEWGTNDKYNQGMLDWNYTGPSEAAHIFNNYLLTF